MAKILQEMKLRTLKMGKSEKHLLKTNKSFSVFHCSLSRFKKMTAHGIEDVEKVDTNLFLVGVQTPTSAMKIKSQLYHSLVYSKDSTSYYRDICSSLFIDDLLIIAKYINNLDVPQQKKG